MNEPQKKDSIVCPSCGAANPAGNRFCGTCGATLVSVAPAAVESVPPRPVNGEPEGISEVPPQAGARGPLNNSNPAGNVAKPVPTIPIPADPMTREREKDRLLTLANVQRMRGQMADARTTLENALAMTEGRPGRDSAPIHELIGDLWAQDERWENARNAYKAAHEAEPSRVSAEKKLAEIALRAADAKLLSMGIVPGSRDEGIRGKGGGGVAAFASAFLPGLGQFYNGQIIKGGICAAIYLLSLIALRLSPDGELIFFKLTHLIDARIVDSQKHVDNPISAMGYLLITLSVVVWVYAVADAAVSGGKATKSDLSRPKVDTSGWDV